MYSIVFLQTDSLCDNSTTNTVLIKLFIKAQVFLSKSYRRREANPGQLDIVLHDEQSVKRRLRPPLKAFRYAAAV